MLTPQGLLSWEGQSPQGQPAPDAQVSEYRKWKTWLTQPLSWTEWLAMLFHLSYSMWISSSPRQSDLLESLHCTTRQLKWCRSFPMPLEGRSRSSSLLKCPSVQISLLVSFPGLCSRRLAHQFPPCSSTYWAFAPALLSALKLFLVLWLPHLYSIHTSNFIPDSLP